jgi:hypothetical protein
MSSTDENDYIWQDSAISRSIYRQN